MTAHKTDTTVWSTQDNDVFFSCCGLTGQLNQGAGSGLSNLGLNDQLLPGALWRVNANADPTSPLCSPSELYQRGDDCISTHPASESFPYQTQLRWTVQPIAAEAGVMVTLTASLQTDLLDTRPMLGLISTLPIGVEDSGAELLDEPGRLIYSGNEAAGWRCFEAIHPLDRSEFEAKREQGFSILKLSPPFLEKGVIRRCRVAACR